MDKFEFVEIYNDVERFPTLRSIATFFDISERSVRRQASRIRNQGVELIDRSGQQRNRHQSQEESTGDIQPNIKLSKVTAENLSLKQQIKDLQKDVLSSTKIKEFIQGTNSIKDYVSVPSWLTSNPSEVKTTGIPVLFLSDIHFDEVVQGNQINYMNEFNHDIAVARLKNTFNTTIDLLKNHMVKPAYDGIVLALGGDLLSGNIHEELAETNDQTILQSIRSLTEILIDGITLLSKNFKRVFVPCVVGNHGRLHKKPRFKNKVYENFEWLIYQNLATYFSNKNSNVTFYIPDGPDAIFSIYNKTFLLTHGDQFNGGNGIAGIFTPLLLGMARKQKNYSSIGKPFQIMMVGHFHQYIHTNSLIVNGTLKGHDEYSAGNGYSYERPQQALFIVHPKYGVIMRMPVLCDKEEERTIKEKIVIL